MKRKFVVVGSCLCSKGFEIDGIDSNDKILEKAFQVAEELGCADMTKSNWWKLFDMQGHLLYESNSWSRKTKTIWKTVCVKDGKTYLLTSKIEERPDGSFVADGQTPEGNDCIIKWFIPHPVDVNDPSDWEEADEVITW